jgi:uncharacterized protein with NRDE domain
MCLIFISFQDHPTYKLIIAGNRDEFYARKTLPAQFWEDNPAILGGRDMEGGGTWMGISRSGRVSMVTNYRDLRNLKPSAPSRGHLVSDFLKNEIDPEDYLGQVLQRGQSYNGFNLFVGGGDDLWYYSNYGNSVQKIEKGFYGISNHLLETPWPKVTKGKQRIKSVLEQATIDPEQLFDVLYDDERAGDNLLPDTGLPLERERALSSMFIKTDGYGSRCSTVILIDHKNRVMFSERSYDTATFDYTTREYSYKYS